MSNVVVVSHKFLTQPDDDLTLFLNEEKKHNVLHIRHSFSDAPDRRSWGTWYKNGNVFKEYMTGDYKKYPEVIVYVKELITTFRWIFNSGLSWDSYVGMDGLCVLFGNFLRSIRKVNKTIYWATDFVPKNRFKSKLKNRIYHWINMQSYVKSDEMWDLSPRMIEAREKFLGIKKSDYKLHRAVPYGVWTERIKKYTYSDCDKKTIVFLGHLLEKQGVQLVIGSIPEIIKHIPDFKFKIIGTGKFESELFGLAKKLGVLEYCDFMGKIDDIRVVENEIAKSCVAVAPYVKNLDTWTYYADPGKIKTYLACGVPVLLTDIPWNAQEISRTNCGVVMSEELNDIKDKILMLMDRERNQEFRNNAISYSKSFDNRNIFSELDFNIKDVLVK